MTNSFWYSYYTPPILTNWIGHLISDLFANDESSFGIQAGDWQIAGLGNQNNRYSSCDKVYLGGPELLNPNGYFERTYSYLPVHNTIYFTINLIIIDNWQSDNGFTIMIDGGVIVSGWNLYQFKLFFPQTFAEELLLMIYHYCLWEYRPTIRLH